MEFRPFVWKRDRSWKEFRPVSVGQGFPASGVSPADISFYWYIWNIIKQPSRDTAEAYWQIIIQNNLKKDCKALGVTLSDEQIQQFLKYYEMLVEWNEVMNLTAITEYDEVMKKHFVDSISLCKAYDVTQNKTVIDVGNRCWISGTCFENCISGSAGDTAGFPE